MIMDIEKNTTGVLLMGGKGSRMGYVDKSSLTYQGTRFFDIAIKALSRFSSTVVSANGMDEKWIGDCRVVQDIVDAGPLGGIYSVLKTIDTMYMFVISCDMPYMNDAMIAHVLEQAEEGYMAYVPRIGEKIEPLCTLYRTDILAYVENNIKDGKFSIRKLFDEIPTQYIEMSKEAKQTFFNVNTPSDYSSVR